MTPEELRENVTKKSSIYCKDCTLRIGHRNCGEEGEPCEMQYKIVDSQLSELRGAVKGIANPYAPARCYDWDRAILAVLKLLGEPEVKK